VGKWFFQRVASILPVSKKRWICRAVYFIQVLLVAVWFMKFGGGKREHKDACLSDISPQLYHIGIKWQLWLNSGHILCFGWWVTSPGAHGWAHFPGYQLYRSGIWFGWLKMSYTYSLSGDVWRETEREICK
jgi:hypothetical protein